MVMLLAIYLIFFNEHNDMAAEHCVLLKCFNLKWREKYFLKDPAESEGTVQSHVSWEL